MSMMSHPPAEEPTVDQIQQDERPDYDAVRVTVETPVNVREVPAVSWSVGKWNINNAGEPNTLGTSTNPVPVMILGNNPRRKRAVISVRSQVAYVAPTSQMANQNDGFVMSSPSYLEVGHQREVWCIGSNASASEVTVLEENYTN